MSKLEEKYKIMENNNNNWQRCPVCYGSGMGHNMYGSGPCNTCSGHGIISTLSGIPPGFKKNETYLGSTTELQNILKPNGKVSTSWDTLEDKEIVYAVKPYKQTEWVAIFRNMDNADKFAKSISGGEWYVIDKVEIDIDTFKKLL